MPQLNNPGEMFTHSYLKRLNPLAQCLYSLVFGIALVLLAHFRFQTDYAVSFAICSGIVFYAIVNPLIGIFHERPLRYLMSSIAGYIVLTIALPSVAHWLGWAWVYSALDFKIILISVSFYYVVAFASIRAMKAFLDFSGGGL